MNEEILEMFLPEGILEWFEVSKLDKNETILRITLKEKNIVPSIPEEHKGKVITSKGFKEIRIDDFPIRGRKTELIFLRRVWQIEDVDTLLKRDIKLCAEGTKLEKEFAVFLKEMDRN